MTKFYKKLFILALPFFLYCVIVEIVDPYNYFGCNNFIQNSIKARISSQINPPLWALIKFKNNPSPNILLGSSTMMAITEEEIKKRGNKVYSSIAYAGSTANELIDTFWLAAKYEKLDNVFIEISFLSWFKLSGDRIAGVDNIISNPFYYFTDSSIPVAIYYIFLEAMNIKKFDHGTPKMSKAKFWMDKLGWGRCVLSKFEYPEGVMKKLKVITRYCRDNKINISFVILPLHNDIYKIIKELNLVNEEIKFKQDLACLATTYDFNYNNSLTTSKDNFSDPVHFNNSIIEYIIDDIFNDQRRFVRIVAPSPEPMK